MDRKANIKLLLAVLVASLALISIVILFQAPDTGNGDEDVPPPELPPLEQEYSGPTESLAAVAETDSYECGPDYCLQVSTYGGDEYELAYPKENGPVFLGTEVEAVGHFDEGLFRATEIIILEIDEENEIQ